MKMRYWIEAIGTIALCGSLAGVAGAWDSVKKTSGGTPVTGKITEVTPQKITIDVKGVPMDIPVNEIAVVAYSEDPDPLRTSRPTIVGKQYAGALESLAKIEVDADTRKEILQDVQFYKALCTAKLALAGEGDVLAAGKMMNAFLTANPTSYHYYEACETIGDLLLASKKYSQAAQFYGKIDAAPWPDFKMRAKLSAARALLAEGKTADAQKAFDEMLAIEAKGEAADQLRTLATLGKARCIIGAGKAAEAAKTAQGLIDKVDSEQTEIQAQAYNVLGMALRAQKKPKEALLAFLHTELLYDGSSVDAQAEAQSNLAVLWGELSYPDRAKRAKEMLADRYRNTPWGQ